MPAMNKGLSVYFALAFIKWLNTPFEDWPEFELGMIDNDGKVIRSPETSEEKKMFNSFSNLVRKLKMLLGKLPGGKSRLASALTTVALLKEEYDFDENLVIEELEKLWPNDHYVREGVNKQHTFMHTIHNEVLSKAAFTVQVESSKEIKLGDYTLLELNTNKGRFYV